MADVKAGLPNQKRLLAIQLDGSVEYPPVIPDRVLYLDGLYYVCSYLLSTGRYAVDLCEMYRGDTPDNYNVAAYAAVLISGQARHVRAKEDLLLRLRQQVDGVPIIFGGPHASFAPYEVLRYGDFAVIGAGELTVETLLDRIFDGPYPTAADCPDNVAMLSDDNSLVLGRTQLHTPPLVPINPVLFKRPQSVVWAAVNSTRGCPHDCHFCYGRRIHGRRLVKQDIGRFKRELADIRKATGISRFYLTDLTFGCDREYTRKLLQEVGGQGYEFVGLTRVDIGDDPELVREWRRGGVVGMYLGIESIDDGVLASYNKGVHADKQKERVLAFTGNGVSVCGTFIFGAEGQTCDDVRKAAEWAVETRMMAAIFACYCDYPFQKMLFNTHQEIPDWRIMLDSPAFHHPAYVSIFPTAVRPSKLQQSFTEGYKLFFEKRVTRQAIRANEEYIRQSKLWHEYLRSTVYARMAQYSKLLEQIEAPYYDSRDRLQADKLREDYYTAAQHNEHHFENMTVTRVAAC